MKEMIEKNSGLREAIEKNRGNGSIRKYNCI